MSEMTVQEHAKEAERLYAKATSLNPIVPFDLSARYVAQAQYHATMALVKQGNWEDA